MLVALRIVLSIATLLTSLFMLGLSIYGLVVQQWILTVVCLFLTAGFGYFNYIDYKFFFTPKPTPVQTNDPPKSV